MSLADWQDAYTDLMYDARFRENWRQGNIEAEGLSPSELEAIKNFPEEKLNVLASSSIRSRLHIFKSTVPVTIKTLIEDKLCHKLAKTYAFRYPRAEIFPRHKGLPAYFTFIKNSLASENIPHLEDVLNYEIISNQLVYFSLPKARPNLRGPLLADWAGLITAGPHFNELIFNLKWGKKPAQLPDNPKHGYLLTRNVKGVFAEKLHWSIYELLKRCHGQFTWQEICEQLIKEEASLNGQLENLLNWEAYYLDKGIIY